MTSICSKCAKAQVLRDFILKHSDRVAQCRICGSVEANLMDAGAPELRSLVRALVRFHYSEWDYNGHLGGVGLERLFFSENEITSYAANWDEDLYNDVILGFVDCGDEDYDTGVSLFAGYDTNGQNLKPLCSLKRDTCPKLLRIEKQLRTTNYFLLEKEVDSLLGPHVSKLISHLPAGTRMHRARIGYDQKALPIWSMAMDDDWHFKPYSAKQLGAPPPRLAGNGRLNRPGVSFLYLCTNEETAISEVRPHPGHHVSVGAFESTRTIQVADFTKVSILDYYRSDKLLEGYLMLKTIDDMFSKPVAPDDRGLYSLTQFLSDGLRRIGFEGVVYRSSVGSGSNLAVFDASSFKYVEGSGRTVQVSQVKYTYSALASMGQKCDYIIDGNGKPV